MKILFHDCAILPDQIEGVMISLIQHWGVFGIVTSKLQGVDHVHEISFPHHTMSENLPVNDLSVVFLIKLLK